MQPLTPTPLPQGERGRGEGPLEAKSAFINDGKPPLHFRKTIVFEELPDRADQCSPTLVVQPKYDNAAMRAGWKAANVGEIEAERQEQPLFRGGGLQYRVVVLASQSLGHDIGNIMAFLSQKIRKIGRHVLVQLELHTVASVCSGCDSSSCASHAA